MTVRAVCISATCCSSDITPRTLVAINEPIATMETATIASAISTSIIVKPASRRSVGAGLVWNNLDPSGQPVDANLVAGVEAGQRDGAAAGCAVGKEADGRQRRLLPARLRQQRIEADVVGNADGIPRRAGTNGACLCVDHGGDAGLIADGGVTIRFQQR